MPAGSRVNNGLRLCEQITKQRAGFQTVGVGKNLIHHADGPGRIGKGIQPRINNGDQRTQRKNAFGTHCGIYYRTPLAGCR